MIKKLLSKRVALQQEHEDLQQEKLTTKLVTREMQINLAMAKIEGMMQIIDEILDDEKK